MTFISTQKELFNKNIEALSNILLKESLKEIKSSKFELILGKDNLDINLKDTSIKNNGGGYSENLLYQDPIKELQTMLNTYILSPLLIQFELNLARIYVLNPKTKEDAFNKSILWIKEHLEFMELVYGHIKAQENALIKNILPLEEKLKERKLDKWMERVRR
ncbi:hypothetical protein AEI19_06705 [Campylobacter jejuni]|nr:hypothetical protein [Campylobacter jejuni]UWN10334.1 hypothetical protein AEI19_06705 [Campylobacter jejuni]